MEDAGSAGEGDSHLQGDGASLPAPVTADDLISDRALEAADEDQFKHKALADRVADLASTAEPPLNIALFGAWGSGKSSIAGFIKENLGHPSRARAVTFAYYDAWKYGGESLRRNFISRAASELELPSDNPANEEFHRGLYQTTRGVRLKDQRLVRMAFIGFGVLAALFVALNLITAVAAGVLSVTTNEDFFGEIGRTLPKALAGTGLAAMAAALATAYVTFAKLDIEESAPSADEEFSERFRKLIDVVRRGPARRLALWGWDRRRPATSAEQPGGPDRIVFFIDELDRCAEEDVVTTLVAIRTFLDEKHCVFIVAADRAVLETALKKAAEQETPTSEDAPYYSTAGAFLDKVFQHQITIPPLRSRRLTRFARDKVLCKGGVWKELRERGSLDDVIYALVPAHIQSPRRIKVLLNNFAINARIAQSREVAWLERASEIAKLTVLQTEYPALADDLHIEPRLPRLLLDTDSTEAQSERAEPLVHRHSLETDDDTDPKRQDAAAFIDEGEKAKRTAMRNQQRRELKRYLERTAEITGPRRDLLYLEAAGEAVDLSDPSLGDAIEDAAPDRPEEVEGLLADADTDDRLAAARLLASMLDDLLPQERTNVMTALTTLTANLGDALSEDVAATVAKSVKAFERHHELAPDHLPGVLEIALRASDADLAQDILAEDDLWLDGARVGRVALRWGQLPEQGQERLAQEVGRVLSEEPSAIGSALAVMTEPQALSLLDAPPVVAAIETAYDNASPQLEAMVESLIDAPFATVEPAPRATQLERTLRPLRPSDGVTYQWLAARRDAIAGALLPEQRYRWVLCMWAAAPHDEWGAWATHLGWPATVDLPDEANPVLERLFREWAQVPLDDEPAWITYARKVVAYAHTDQAEVAPFVSGLEAALVDRWGTGEGDVESRKRLHDTARTTTALGGATANEVRRLLGKDLSDELQQGSSPGMLDAVEELAVELSLDETKEVAKQVRRSDPASSPEEAADELAVVAGLALEAKSWGGNEWQAPEFALPYSDTVAHILGTSAAPKVLERWLRLDPPQGDVRTALRTYPDTPTVGLREAIEEWAGGQKRTHLMPLAKSLLNQNKNNSPVLEAVTSGDVAQMPLAKELEKRIDAAGSSDLRRRYATKTAALRLEVPQARNKVADVALARLKSGVKSDIPVAVELVAGLGKPLPKLPALRKAFAQAGHKFSADEAAKLASVEIIPPEDSLPKKFLKKFLGS